MATTLDDQPPSAATASPPRTSTGAYENQLAWLYGRQALGIKLGLGKVHALLDALGNPQEAFSSIHVAGTNGKGSVTRLLASTLREAGYRTGCTTSPHLVRFTERIEVDGQPIAEEAVARLLGQLRPHVAALDEAGTPPTFFEVVTALAFLAFREAGVQWAVVETGMGGRLDATNVLQPALTIITNVALDHMAYLGSTVGAIALEKAGIMKPGVPCVTAATGEAALVLKATSHAVQCPMSIVGEDYHVVPGPDHRLDLVRPNGEAHYPLALAGRHQQENAAVVVAAADALRKSGLAIPEQAVRHALATTQHPGRLQRFESSHPARAILVDGAHNPAAAHALAAYLRDEQWTGIDLVAGFCADKDWKACLDAWLPFADHVWAVPVRNPRSLDRDELADYVRSHGVRASTARDVEAALSHAGKPSDRRVVVAGSLFLSGEAIAILTGQGLEDIHGAQ